MGERKAPGVSAYTEAQTKAWLSWLARGMQQHGQTVFMIEQLQPSWLSSPLQRASYLLASRSIAFLICGFLFTLVFIPFARSLLSGDFIISGNPGKPFDKPDELVVDCLFFSMLSGMIGLIIGLVDVARLNLRSKRPLQSRPTRAWEYLWCTFFAGFVIFTATVVSLVMVVPMMATFVPTYTLVDNFGFFFFVFLFEPVLVIIWGSRSTRRSLRSDIRCVETLTFSQPHAKRGFIAAFVLVLCVGCAMFWISRPEGFKIVELGRAATTMVIAGVFTVIAGVFFGVFVALLFGLRRGIVEMKTMPNQGIILSIRSAVKGAIVVGMIPVFLSLFVNLWFFVRVEYHDFLWGGPSSYGFSITGLVSGLTSGVVVGLGVALFTGLWYGGLDVIQHFLLRVILYVSGSAPLNYVRFLDHAATDLNFLQKVGGGYIFIHRILLEHFAAMENEGTSNPPATPTLAAPIPFESVSGK